VKPKEAPPETTRAKGKAKPSRTRARASEQDQLESHAQRFFAEGEAMAEGDDRLTLPSESEASALAPPHPQRGAFLRYVGIAVGLCAVVGLAGLARHTLAHANASEAPEPIVTTAAPAPSPDPIASGIPAPPVAVAIAPSASAAASGAPSAEPAPAAPEVPLKSALEEREDARKALERGKFEEAISAALRSTAIDPTDADAWLLLGAAYQESGKGADARVAYGSCAKEAKKGAVRECQLMLR
jgi:tetratricopeptide (TPR) repeat protein